MRHQPDQLAGFSQSLAPRRKRRLDWIPWALTTLRLFMAKVALWTLAVHPRPLIFVICLIVAFVTDIYDGIIARRLGVSTPAMRRYDSVTDLIFYLSILYCAWKLYPQVVRHFGWPIAVVLILDGACHLVSFIKFRRPASTHCYSAKLWGILLFASFIALLGFGQAGILLWVTIIWGCLADLEVMVILLTARTWPSDVASVFHARRLCRTAADPI